MALKRLLDKVDNETILDKGDMVEVIDVMDKVAASYSRVGLCLRLPSNDLDIISANHSKSVKDCLGHVLKAWLNLNYDSEKHGMPTWRKLAEAAFKPSAGNNRALAKAIADAHPVQSGVGDKNVTSMGSSSAGCNSRQMDRDHISNAIQQQTPESFANPAHSSQANSQCAPQDQHTSNVSVSQSYGCGSLVERDHIQTQQLLQGPSLFGAHPKQTDKVQPYPPNGCTHAAPAYMQGQPPSSSLADRTHHANSDPTPCSHQPGHEEQCIAYSTFQGQATSTAGSQQVSGNLPSTMEEMNTLPIAQRANTGHELVGTYRPGYPGFTTAEILPVATVRASPSQGGTFQGPTVQASPSQGGTLQEPTVQASPSHGGTLQGPTVQASPSQGGTFQGPTVQASLSQGAMHQTGPPLSTQHNLNPNHVSEVTTRLRYAVYFRSIGDDSYRPGPNNGDDSYPPDPNNGDNRSPPSPNNGEDSSPPGPNNGEDSSPPTPNNGEDSSPPGPNNGEDSSPPGPNNGDDSSHPGPSNGEDSSPSDQSNGEDSSPSDQSNGANVSRPSATDNLGCNILKKISKYTRTAKKPAVKPSKSLIEPSKSYEPLPPEKKYEKIRLAYRVEVKPVKGEKRVSRVVGKYGMDKFPHGIAVIVNVCHVARHSKRTGTEVDEEMLINTLRYLGYIVKVYMDPEATDMCKILEHIQTRDHSQYDSFVCCILSHGADSDKIYGSDGKFNLLDSLANKLIATKCPSLNGKPKMFFIQACRGSKAAKEVIRPDDPKSTAGATSQRSEDASEATNGIPTQPSSITVDGGQPAIADFIFSFATSPGYVANRETWNGSWYMKELCTVLCKHSTYMPLGDMLKLVNNNVGEKYRDTHGSRQAPWYSDNSVRNVFF